MFTIRTRLTLVVIFATVAGAVVGWLLRQHALFSGAFVGGVAVTAVATFLLSRTLVTDPATSILQAVSDGLLSFSEREYGMRLAVAEHRRTAGRSGAALQQAGRGRCAPSTAIATSARSSSRPCWRRPRWRSSCATKRCASSTRTAPRAICSAAGASWTARTSTRSWPRAPAAFREAIERETDTIFSVETAADGGRRSGRRLASAPETYHLARRYFQLSMQPHILFILKPLTRAILRKEADTWKRTIRVISHEINNSLAPISSLIHSGRLMLQKPEMVPRLAEALDTIEERSTPPARVHRGLREVRAPAAARQAGEPLGSR